MNFSVSHVVVVNSGRKYTRWRSAGATSNENGHVRLGRLAFDPVPAVLLGPLRALAGSALDAAHDFERKEHAAANGAVHFSNATIFAAQIGFARFPDVRIEQVAVAQRSSVAATRSAHETRGVRPERVRHVQLVRQSNFGQSRN